jgi:hypothetical protein
VSIWPLALFLLVGFATITPAAEDSPLHVGIAVVDITPGESYPMSGYYHERLSTATKDPLFAKAIVFRQGDVAAAWVACDLIGIAADLTAAVRERAAPKTGIPAGHIILSATHTHTGPDYGKELYAVTTGRPIPKGRQSREPYVPRLIEAIASAIVQANDSAKPMAVAAGAAVQDAPVAFNRRFLMKDGTVRTWGSLKDPNVVHAAGPIDPEIGMVVFRDPVRDAPSAVVSSFALHLDTVGGTEWSADYPFFIERTIKKHLGGEVVSAFGTGCCGNINHVDPTKTERNKTDFIGTSLGTTICNAVPKLAPVEQPRLQVRRAVVAVPLQNSTKDQLEASKRLLREIQNGRTADFFAHVDAYKRIVLDGLRNRVDGDEAMSLIGWGLTSSLSGSGDRLPLEIQAITLGRDVAIVAFPGEAFVELGLAIKNASPFRTTLVVELSNVVETVYIPHRYAYVGGGYEVINSTLEAGSGELLAEAAIRLLAESARELAQDAK